MNQKKVMAKVCAVFGLLMMSVPSFASNKTTTTMASQPWVKMTVSNEVNKSKSDMKTWVKSYVGAGGADLPDVDRETEVWTDNGTNFNFKAFGTVHSFNLLSISVGRTTKGFYVYDCDNVNGCVSNGMTYAYVGEGTYSCPSNSVIPVIVESGSVTQEIDNLTYVFKKFKVEEKRTTTNNVPRSVYWQTQQIDPKTWRVFQQENVNGVFEVREFKIMENNVSALPESPDVAWSGFYNVLKDFAPNRFVVNRNAFDSITSAISSLFCSSAYAVEIAVASLNGMSGVMTFSVQGDDGSVQTFNFGFNYHGPIVEWKPIHEDYEEELDDKTVVHHFKMSPSFYPTKADWSNIGNWLDPFYTIDLVVRNEATGELETSHTTIPLQTILAYCGNELLSKINGSWIEPQEQETTEEETKDCENGVHTFLDNTCKCRYCKYDRHHNMKSQEGDCMKCQNPRGKVNVNTGKLIEGNGDLCEGREEGVAYHVGWHPVPSKYLNDPPKSAGDYYSCCCTCGFYNNKDKRLQHEIGTKPIQTSYGDLEGENQDDFHTLAYECSRCVEYPKGWTAKVEAHNIKETGEVSPFYYDFDGNPQPTTSSNLDPDTRPDAANMEKHIANGICKVCKKEIHNKLLYHTLDANCTCACGVQVHTWEDIECHNAAHCVVCDKWFFKDDEGIVHLDRVGEDMHDFGGEESQIWVGENPNMEVHVCHCKKQVKQNHNWVSDQQDEKNVYCGEPDGPTKDENGNWIHGCLLSKHNKETCPMDEAIGTCGNWYCPVCGKSLTVDKDGNVAPTVHGTYQQGVDDPPSSKHYVSGRTEDDVYHCALCAHEFLGGKCGSHFDSDGNVVNKRNTVIGNEQPRCHNGWKPIEGHESSGHQCQCGACVIRPHNWGSKVYSYHYGTDGVSETIHDVHKICDARESGSAKYDDCFYDYNGTEEHTFYHTIPKEWRNYNGTCQEHKECREYESSPIHNECGFTKWFDTTHDWQPIGVATQRWVTSESADSSYHDSIYECNHEGLSRGCGIRKSEKVSHSFGDSEWGWTKNSVVDGVIQNDGEHWKIHRCERPVDSGICGYTGYALQPQHHVLSFRHIYESNSEHLTLGTCTLSCPCRDVDFGLFYHDRYGQREGEYEYVGDGAYSNRHNGLHHCDSCDHSYKWPVDESCDYDWIGADWYLSSEHEVPDSAVCGYCRTRGKVQHFFVCDDDLEGHHCANGSGHLSEDHDYVWTKEDQSEGYCTMCDWERTSLENVRVYCKKGCHCWAEYNILDVETDPEGFIIRVIPDLESGPVDQFCISWNNDSQTCNCASCSNGNPFECVCCGNVTDNPRTKIVKFGDGVLGGENIQDSQFMYVLILYTNLGIVDGSEPVITVAHRGFYGAWYGCPNLWYANFSKCILAEEEAFACCFSNCVSFEVADFSVLTNVGRRAFAYSYFGCKSITNLNYPALAMSGEYGFEGAFKETNPLELNFPSMASVDEGAFKDCNTMVSITLPCVTNIGEFAFKDCDNLEYIHLEDCVSVPYLASTNAFEGVYEFCQIVVSEDLYDEWIQSDVWNSDSLRYRIVTPSMIRNNVSGIRLYNVSAGSVVTIGNIEVEGSITWDWGDGNVESNLTSSPSPHTYQNSANYQIRIEGKMREIGGGRFVTVTGSANPIVRKFNNNTVRKIGNDSFRNESNLQVANGNSVTNIGAYAFAFCDSLTSVNMLNVKSIGEYAFLGCQSLNSVSFPNLVEFEDGNAFYEGNPFADCHNLSYISIPKVKTLNGAFRNEKLSLFIAPIAENWKNDGGFEDCHSLTDIYAPNLKNCHHILNCDNLLSLELPSLTNCPVILTCGRLEKVYLPNVHEVTDDFDGCSNLYSIAFASDATLGESAGFAWTKIRQIPTPNTKNVPDYAFYYCTSLTGDIDLPLATNIGSMAFASCKNIRSLKANRARFVGDSAISSSHASSDPEVTMSLNSIEMNNVIELGSYAISYLPNLETITMYSLEKIGERAISNNPKLTTLNIDDEILTEVGMYGLEGNDILESLDFVNLRKADKGAFSGCTSVKRINLPNIQECADDAFSGIGGNLEYLCLGLAEIPQMFTNCGNLRSISFPNATNVVCSFRSCPNLSTYSAPNAVSISGTTWSDLLYTLNLPNVENLGEEAFSECHKLNSVNLPKVKMIGRRAFYSNSTYQRVLRQNDFNCVIGSSLDSIGEGAFDRGSQSETDSEKHRITITALSYTISEFRSKCYGNSKAGIGLTDDTTDVVHCSDGDW